MNKVNFEHVFLEAAKALDFLQSEHSFAVWERQVHDPFAHTQHVGGWITYAEKGSFFKRPQRFVRLSVAPLRLEIDLMISFQLKNPEGFYSMHELHRLEDGGPFPERKYSLYDALKDSVQLYHEFETLGTVLKQCGSRFFANDQSLWADLRRQRIGIMEMEEYTRMRMNAEKAFKEKNWQKVVDLLEGKALELSELDFKRLQYAQKQLQQ